MNPGSECPGRASTPDQPDGRSQPAATVTGLGRKPAAGLRGFAIEASYAMICRKGVSWPILALLALTRRKPGGVGLMNRRYVTIVTAGAALAALVLSPMTAAGAAPASSGGTWGKAREVPGIGSLNIGGDAGTTSVSCTSPGNCLAGGLYAPATGKDTGFIAVQKNGQWGKAREVPGLGKLNLGGYGAVSSVSCASAGNCVAGGTYSDRSDYLEAFLVTEKGGRWSSAREAPGSGQLNLAGSAAVDYVACPSAGNCTAVGKYEAASGDTQGFAVDETDGVWGQAQEIPGLGALNKGDQLYVQALSCGSAGNCSVGGRYFDASGHAQAFIADEKHGTWRSAHEVPGTSTLNVGGVALVDAISCWSAGNCEAGGWYEPVQFKSEPFVVAEKNGTWGNAQEVKGAAALNKGGGGGIYAISCASAGNCVAGGAYETSGDRTEVLLVTERGGTWGKAEEAPGTEHLNIGGSGEIATASCASAGNCAVGGYYYYHHHAEAFIESQASGRWAKAQEVPGTATLNAGGEAGINTVNCASPGHCTAGGGYETGKQKIEAFVVSEK
jgi:hypothetical protein